MLNCGIGSPLEWNSVVHPSHCYDQFLTLSPSSDVMVRVTRTATPNQTLLCFEPLGRVEISAKEIRGRIEQMPSGSSPAAMVDSAAEAAVATRDLWMENSCVTPQPKSPGSPVCADFHRSAHDLFTRSYPSRYIHFTYLQFNYLEKKKLL